MTGLRKTFDSRHKQKEKIGALAESKYPDDNELALLKMTLLEMLDDISKAFNSAGFSWSLGGGSVLGTIRHKGFIPWDDDIDLNITRTDFNNLLSQFDDLLGDKYVLCAPELGKQHGLAHAQIKKKGTICRSFHELAKTDEQSGIFIDLFVAESVPDSRFLYCIHGFFCLFFGYLLSCRKCFEDAKALANYTGDSAEAMRVFSRKARIGSVLRWIPLDGLAMLTVRVYSLYSRYNTGRIAFPTGRGHYFKETYPRSELCNYVKMMFEGREVNVPVGYSHYMEVLYGRDYMIPPALEERERHPFFELDFGR